MSERILTKKDLSKVLNRYVWARQSPFNYETMQSGGWVWAIHPAMAKIYDNDKEVLSAKPGENVNVKLKGISDTNVFRG